VYWCNKLLFHKTLLVREASSVQGERVDAMLWVTLAITGVVFFITQITLFWFAYRYQENPKRKAFYFPHNNTMEIIWTVVPAVTLTVLVVIGLRNWFFFTSEAPKNALHIEVTGRQFGWIFRYPGHDGTFGKKYFREINNVNNSLGLIWQDNPALKLKDDPATHDDIVTEGTVYVVKGRPVEFIIGSRDVIHDVGLPQFRMKMDAVPGTPTTLWFTPKFTTKEMKEKTGNPDFQYEISCDQMCGNGHYSMKGVVEVVTQEEYDLWLAKQQPAYLSAFPAKEAPKPAAAPAADSAKAKSAVVAKDSTGALAAK
jgi:cytochrome c oxidase subunit 2